MTALDETGHHIPGQQFMLDERSMLVRYGVVSLSVSVVHLLISLLFYFNGVLQIPIVNLINMFVAIWLLNAVLFSLIWFGKTANYKDPTLSFLWSFFMGLGFLYSAYFMDAFRIALLMPFFGVLMLASFRRRLPSLLLLALLAIFGYAAVIYAVYLDRSVRLSMSLELLQWFVFTLTILAFAFTGAGVNQLRQRLSSNNEALRDAIAQVHDMAIKDELTGLFNRRHIMDLLDQQKALADSGDYSFCLCYMDLDHFKKINDTFGHGVGDQVLIRFASIMQDVLRDADDCGRLGGEEFVMILSRTTLDNASLVAERLRQRLLETSFRDLDENLAVTVSIGISEYQCAESVDESLARADAALYVAKENGRNQVVTSDHPDVSVSQT